MTAFAFGRLARVNVFHHSPGNSVTLEHPFRLYQVMPPQVEQAQLANTMLRRTCRKTCFDRHGLVMVRDTQAVPRRDGRTRPPGTSIPEGSGLRRIRPTSSRGGHPA